MAGMNDNLSISPAGLDLIKKYEGFRSHVYLDVGGFSTIGYGHRLLPGERFPDGITEAQATTLLLEDVRTAENAVKRLVTVPLTQGQFDALVDFTYQFGQGRLAESTLLATLNSRRYNAIPGILYHVDEDGEPHGWIFADGKPQPGIIARREADIELWNGEQA